MTTVFNVLGDGGEVMLKHLLPVGNFQTNVKEGTMITILTLYPDNSVMIRTDNPKEYGETLLVQREQLEAAINE